MTTSPRLRSPVAWVAAATLFSAGCVDSALQRPSGLPPAGEESGWAFDFVPTSASGSRPTPPAASTVPSSASAPAAPEPAPKPLQTCIHGLDVRLSPALGPGSRGSVRQDTAATLAGRAPRRRHASPRPEHSRIAALRTAGALDTAADLTQLFAPNREPSSPRIAENGDTVGIVATVWPTAQNGEIALVTMGPDGRSSRPLLVDPDPLYDSSPEIAAGPPGRFAVVWERGVYPSPASLAVAIVDRGRVVARRTIVESALAEGLSITGTAKGYLVVYTSSSASSADTRGLYAVALGPDGEVIARHRFLRGADVLWPIAAWDGGGTGVAFRHGRRVGFIRLAEDGRALTPEAIVQASEDPLASFRAMSLLFHKGLYWLGTTAAFSASVLVVAPNQAYLVAVQPDGAHTEPLLLPESRWGTVGSALTSSSSGVRGVFVQDAYGTPPTLQTFDASCRAEAPVVAPAPTPGPCDDTRTPFVADRYGPMKAPFALAADGADLIVASTTPGPGDSPNPPSITLARMSRDGRVRYRAAVAQGYDPEVVVSDGEVGLVFRPPPSGAALRVATFDAATGAPRATRDVRGPQGGRSGGYCIGRRASGYMLVTSGSNGSFALRLRSDGVEEGVTELLFPFGACSLAPSGAGWLFAYTRSGIVSESSIIAVRTLDARGAASTEQVIEGHFGSGPALVARGSEFTLVWTGPFARDVTAQDLLADGQPSGDAQKVVKSYGLLGYGLLPDGDRSRLIFATKSGYGERRLCTAGGRPSG